MPADDWPADVLNDLATNKNTLSVWYIEESFANLPRVLAPLAGTREFVSNLDFALVGFSAVSSLHVPIQETVGMTPDAEVNTRWHRDLGELSVRRVELLVRLFSGAGRFQRYSEGQVEKILLESWQTGHLASSQLSQNLREKLNIG